MSASRDNGSGQKQYSETVLVVDDNESLARVAAAILGKQGYRVIRCENGAEAEDLPPNVLAGIDLVVADVLMPELNGPSLVERLARRDIRPAVLYMSGYLDALRLGRTSDGRETHFIPKPWTAVMLASAARRALDGRLGQRVPT